MSETPQNTYELYESAPETQPQAAHGAFERPSSPIENVRRGDMLSTEAKEAAHQAGEIAMVMDITARLKLLRSRKVAEPRKMA